MLLYRLVNSKYKDDHSGYGASLYGGRWNSPGVLALYCAQCISLSVLELVVNFNPSDSAIKQQFHLIEFEYASSPPLQLKITELKKNWRNDFNYTRFIGDEFIKNQSHLILQIPSAVIPEEHNYLINPLHKDLNKLRIRYSKNYPLDSRLLGS